MIGSVRACISAAENVITLGERRDTLRISPSQYHYNKIGATKCLNPSPKDGCRQLGVNILATVASPGIAGKPPNAKQECASGRIAG
jgi:hypothetical protein